MAHSAIPMASVLSVPLPPLPVPLSATGANSQQQAQTLLPQTPLMQASRLSVNQYAISASVKSGLPDQFTPQHNQSGTLARESTIRQQAEALQPAIDMQAPQPVQLQAFKVAVAGGISGALAKTCTAPLSRLTILYQVEAVQNRIGLWSALRNIAYTEGIFSLWKGNLATILHRLPYSAANFATYELCKVELEPHLTSDVSKRLLSGAVSGLVACSAAYPLDLVRTRLAAQTTEQRYHGMIDCLKKIVRQEGALGLYKGLGATLLQVVPGLALNFTFYDSFKHALSPKDARQPSAETALAAACMAAVCASSLTFPLDVVRRRMQVYGEGQVGSPVNYWQAVKLVQQHGGLRMFYAGIIPEYFKVVPGMAIAFTTYEALKQLLKVH